MKQHILIAGLATAFMLLAGGTLCAQDTELRIYLKINDQSYFEKKTGERKVYVKNELGKEVKVGIGNISLPIPKDSFVRAYDLLPDGRIEMQISPEQRVTLPSMQDIGKTIVIKVGGETVRDGSKPPPPTKADPPATTHIFAPDAAAQERYRSQTSTIGTGCKGIKPPDVPGSAVVYNYQDQCFCHFQNGKPVDQKRLRPRVDEHVHFAVASYHPYRDSISVSTEFANRNQEYGEQAVALLNQQWKGGESKAEETKKDSTSEESAITPHSQTDTVHSRLITDFAKEMASFYYEQRNSPNLTLDFLHRCVLHINEQVKSVFDIPNTTPESILAAGKKWIENAKLPSEKAKELSAELDKGVDYYRRITTYNIIRFKPVQIEDADLTEVTVKTFRDRKLQDDKPRPYRYFNRGGFKIDFSFGVFASGLVDHNFTTAPVKVLDTLRVAGQPSMIDTILEVTKGRVIREKGDSYNFGLGILSHYYSRWLGPRFNLSLTGGLLVDTDKRTKYLVGGSILLGSEQRAVISGGWIFGKVKRLAEGLEEDKSLLNTTAGQVTQVPTREINQNSWFISLTYNFGTLPKKK